MPPARPVVMTKTVNSSLFMNSISFDISSSYILDILETPVSFAALITASATMGATALFRADGIIFSSFSSSSGMSDASA